MSEKELTNEDPEFFHQFIAEDADVKGALEEIVLSAGFDGAHHKDWVIDQVVRKLTGDKYEDFVKAYETPIVYSDAPGDYAQQEWLEGIAP